MTKIYEILLAGTVFFGIYAGFVLIFLSKQNRLLNRLLAAIMLTYSLVYFLIFCVNRHWAPDFIVLIRTFTPLYYFLPALIYLYIRAFIQDETRLTRKDWWHLAPFALHVIYISPLVVSIISGETPWQTIMATVNEKNYFFNAGPIPDAYHVILRLGLLLFYTFLVWKAFLGKKYRDFVARNREVYPYAIRWISFFAVTITANAVFSMFMKTRIFFFQAKAALFYGDFVSLGLLISLDLLIAYAILNPVILFGLPHFKRLWEPKMSDSPVIKGKTENIRILQQPTENSVITDYSENEIVTEKVAAPPMTVVEHPAEAIRMAEKEMSTGEKEKMDLLIARMNEYVESHQPYRQNEFNMAELSRLMDVPEHHLAFIFRHILKKSFVDYRNELRVQYVIKELKKGIPKELTIEAIGMEAGFNSRATFFAVFKKHTGKTPTQYLKS